MKLDRFEEIVKPLDFELNTVEAKLFMRGLANEFQGQLDDLESEINGTVGFDEILANSLCQTESLTTQLMDNAIKLHVNNLIRATKEDIEDIEYVNKIEPEDCMDIDKRAKEMDHD